MTKQNISKSTIILEWKDLPWFNGDYKYNELGQVWSAKSQKLVGEHHNNQYILYSLYDGEKTVTMLQHRLVWEWHKGTIPATCDIHHKDEYRRNNNINNLSCIDKKVHKSAHLKLRWKVAIKLGKDKL